MLASSVSDLVSTDWLSLHLAGPDADVVVVDASLHLENGRDAHAEYLAHHLPGARFFDLRVHACKTGPAPLMLPAAEDFAEAMNKLGISNEDHVVVYDASDSGVFSAPRLWWMLRVFGHHKVSVLDGGLSRWLSEDRPTENGPMTPKRTNFLAATPDARLLRTKAQVLNSLTSGSEIMIDTRPSGPWRGADAEPAPGLQSGHAPGSKNLPYTSVLDDDAKTLLPPAQLREVFIAAGANPAGGRPMFVTCGDGISACLVALAAQIAFPTIGPLPIYDGGWSEWTADPACPVERGAESQGLAQRDHGEKTDMPSAQSTPPKLELANLFAMHGPNTAPPAASPGKVDNSVFNAVGGQAKPAKDAGDLVAMFGVLSPLTAGSPPPLDAPAERTDSPGLVRSLSRSASRGHSASPRGGRGAM
eukprot:m.139972 g.139972  ORF g.139972 m.139972 type:complete len:417 (-) comp9624_c0_seq1:163-1413(-)